MRLSDFSYLIVVLLVLMVPGTSDAGDVLYRMMNGDQELLGLGTVVSIDSEKNAANVEIFYHFPQSKSTDTDVVLVNFNEKLYNPKSDTLVVDNNYLFSLDKTLSGAYMGKWGAFEIIGDTYKTAKLSHIEEADDAALQWFVNSGGKDTDFYSKGDKLFVRKEGEDDIEIYSSKTVETVKPSHFPDKARREIIEFAKRHGREMEMYKTQNGKNLNVVSALKTENCPNCWTVIIEFDSNNTQPATIALCIEDGKVANKYHLENHSQFLTLQKCQPIETLPELSIYLSKNNLLVLSGDDIVSYQKDTHEVKLTDAGAKKVAALEIPSNGRPFTFMLSGEKLYDGSFWSYVSSLSYSGIVIMGSDIVSKNTVKILLDYGFFSDFEKNDPRNNKALFDYLENAGKLID